MANLPSPPDAPSRSDPSTFATRADAFVAWISTFVSAANQWVNTPYESGVWTPVLADDETGGNVASFGSSGGRYTSVGGLLLLSGNLVNINTAGMTGGNPIWIRGLPEPAGGAHHATCAVKSNRITYAGSSPFLYLQNGKSALRLQSNSSGGDSVDLTVAAISSGAADIYFSLAYQFDPTA